MPKTSKVDGLVKSVHQAELTPAELRQVAAACEALAEFIELGYDTPETTENRTLTNGQATGHRRGHIESKKIRGHGPYDYLRYWSGGRLRSVYLGKSKVD